MGNFEYVKRRYNISDTEQEDRWSFVKAFLVSRHKEYAQRIQSLNHDSNLRNYEYSIFSFIWLFYISECCISFIVKYFIWCKKYKI